jgi:hypothetical protein
MIEFNLTSIPTNATVSSALLSFYYSTSLCTNETNHTGSNASYLRRILTAWGELTVTWNTQPTTTTVNQVSLAPLAASLNVLNINVTTMVQDMVTNPSTNFGWMLQLVSEPSSPPRKLVFGSSDCPDSTVRPMLVVTYTAPVPLPVELLSFEVANNSSGNILSWATGSETNNNGFEVQLSLSGYENSFEMIGWRDGNGTSSETHSYSFEDKNTSSAKVYYYRLKQIDYDGKTSFSKIISCTVSIPKIELIVHPNPFSENTNITYMLSKNSFARLEVYNVTGQKVVTLANKFHEAGNYQFQFSPAAYGFAPGVFQIILIVNDQVYTSRIIETK